ncbi:hypothetical protein PCANC_22086 [Puccinia coronata f. sp. avenae]|uniref:No apical meristem-associated C-terminal domain-containing protein n=1 Tax=Puccinia coronata f. sp. avenae TaxID=200324 RepID=A0A2N5SEU5_9BASI|nr:hypothetical protein PCANC_22086 [Puccinia coronata f. sp. avenae]
MATQPDPNTTPSSQANTPENTNSTHQKKKRAPNWLPRKEEQLAISWLRVKATDVTSVAQTDFMLAGPTDTLEQRNNVSVGPADVTSVYKTDVTSVAATDLAAGGCNRYNPFGGASSSWTSLNTATLKFSAIYNALERNLPSGTSTEDWLITAKTAYQDQTKGTPFNSLAAWTKLRYSPKWRPDPNTSSTPASSVDPLSDTINPDDDNGERTLTGICTPSARSANSIARPMGQKATKKQRLDGLLDDNALLQAGDFASISRDRFLSLNKGNDILEQANVISSGRLTFEEKKYLLEKKRFLLDEKNHLLEEKKFLGKEEARQSQSQVSDLKMLCEPEDLDNEATKEVLMKMKAKILKKWRDN